MKASMLFGPDYECKYEWECFCQAGKSGLVLAGENSYTTAFFEAFPSNPNCFIRGEGGTVEEAEEQCWQKYQKIRTCNHEMERRGRTDGYGYCKHCSYSAMVFEPLTKCCKCGKLTAYSKDTRGRFYCETCSRVMPKSVTPKYDLYYKDRIPRRCKKKVKQGASMKLYGGNRYGKVKMKISFDIRFDGNGRSVFTLGIKRMVRNMVRLSRLKKRWKLYRELNG